MGEVCPSAAIEIRPAMPADADGIARVYLESAAYHADLDPERYFTPAVDTIASHYRQPPDGPQTTTFVAHQGHEIVGFIDARLEHSDDAMHREMTYCHIAEIAVRAEHRSQGIGGRLLQAAEDWGRSKGAAFASLEYHAANEPAARFYNDHMGYHPAAVTAIKRL